MKPFVPLFKYLGGFLLLYFFLYFLMSIPAIARLSSNIYRATTQPVLESFFSKAYLKLQSDNTANPDPNLIRLVYAGKKEIQEQTELARQRGDKSIKMKATESDLYFNLFFTTFFVFLVALILVTPISFKDKIIAFFLGSFLFYLYTLLKLTIFLFNLFNKSVYQMYKLGDFASGLFEGLTNLLTSLGFSSFIIILIWVFVAFRKSNWKDLLQGFGKK